MNNKENELIWEMWEASAEEKRRAYIAGRRDGESGESMGEVSDNWGPAGDAYVDGFRDGEVFFKFKDLLQQKREAYPDVSIEDLKQATIEDLESEYSEIGDESALSILQGIASEMY